MPPSPCCKPSLVGADPRSVGSSISPTAFLSFSFMEGACFQRDPCETLLCWGVYVGLCLALRAPCDCVHDRACFRQAAALQERRWGFPASTCLPNEGSAICRGGFTLRKNMVLRKLIKIELEHGNRMYGAPSDVIEGSGMVPTLWPKPELNHRSLRAQFVQRNREGIVFFIP